jgi:hypothetical protein
VTATITRHPGRPAKAPRRPGLESLRDAYAPEPAWIDHHENPDPGWVDEVLVERAIAGRYDLLDRPLTWAESVLVVGYVLDKVHEAVSSGYKPERTMSGLSQAMGWSGTTQAKLSAEARPEHSKRMAKARAEYKSWDIIAAGHNRSHRKTKDPKVGRNRSRKHFMGKTWMVA